MRKKRRDDDTPRTAREWARYYFDMGDHRRAVEQYHQVFGAALDDRSLFPKDIKDLTRLAESYWRLGRNSDAEEVYRKAIAVGEASGHRNGTAEQDCLKSYARFLRDAGRTSQAEEREREADALDEVIERNLREAVRKGRTGTK